jgi:hypothetical protein
MTDVISLTELELAMRKLANQVKLDTIEACAKIAEKNMHSSIMPGHVGKNIAAEIRSLSVSSQNRLRQTGE